MKWIDYRKKLGLGFDNYDLTNQFQNMIENELVFLNSTEDAAIKDYMFKQFKLKTFLATAVISMDELNGIESLYDLIIKELRSREDDFEEYLALFVLFINCNKNDVQVKKFRGILINCMEYVGLQFEIIEDEDGIFVFPNGAKEMDDGLISEPLLWMADYKASRKVFIEAMKMYSDQKTNSARSIADQFRKALEAFFQEFFKSNKSLENYKSEYGDYLKENQIPAEIANNFVSLLNSYTLYMNNYVKHQDKAQANVLEYIMYQTWNIVRLMIKLKGK